MFLGPGRLTFADVTLERGPTALASEHPVLASCYGASAGDVQLLGEKPGERVDRLTLPVLLTPILSDALAEVGGVNVRAKVSVDGRDRERVEKLCRYLARPPVAQDRLSIEPEGMVRYDFKNAWKDGTRGCDFILSTSWLDLLPWCLRRAPA